MLGNNLGVFLLKEVVEKNNVFGIVFRSEDFYSGYYCRFWLACVTGCQEANKQEWRQSLCLGNMLKHGEVQWTVIRQAEIVSWIDTGGATGPRWPHCRTSAGWEGFPSGMAMPVGTASKWPRLQNAALFESLWPRSTGTKINFCENSTALFTVSESSVLLIKISQS